MNFLEAYILKSIAVFCGSRFGVNPLFKEKAVDLGKKLAENNITLIYGGANVGIMGLIADTVLAEGGKVIGVMPKSLEEREITHENLSELYIVDTMHERKQKMMDLSDGFIVYPGGIGTMEEYFEVFTWNMIGIIDKPCVLLNIEDYYTNLGKFLEQMCEEGFLNESAFDKSILTNSIDEAIKIVTK